MLEIQNISKSFNSKLVVDNLSFKVDKDRIFGLIGPNGAGKTTTLRIILNILLPTSGRIIFENKKLDQQYLNFTGYLPEERGLYPKSSVSNSLTYLAQLKGKTFSEASKICEYWLDRLNLLEMKNYNLEELSKGNQQKVQFISAIQHNPKVLILDEPFSGFDPVNQSIFTEILNEIQKDKYVILSTHLMDLAENLCKDFILINNGREVLKGDLENILNSYHKNMYEIVLGKSEKIDSLQNLANIEIVESEGDRIRIDIKDSNPSDILKLISSQKSVIGFRKIIPSLHELFISQVEGK